MPLSRKPFCAWTSLLSPSLISLLSCSFDETCCPHFWPKSLDNYEKLTFAPFSQSARISSSYSTAVFYPFLPFLPRPLPFLPLLSSILFLLSLFFSFWGVGWAAPAYLRVHAYSVELYSGMGYDSLISLESHATHASSSFCVPYSPYHPQRLFGPTASHSAVPPLACGSLARLAQHSQPRHAHCRTRVRLPYHTSPTCTMPSCARSSRRRLRAGGSGSGTALEYGTLGGFSRLYDVLRTFNVRSQNDPSTSYDAE